MTYYINTVTGRFVSEGSKTFKKCLKNGQLKKVSADGNIEQKETKVEEVIAEPTIAIAPVKKAEKVSQKKLQEQLIDQTIDIIANDRQNLVGYSQSELDEIIKLRLYQRLCESSVPKMHIKETAKKDRRRKPKKKVVFVSSSESESSTTE